MSDERWLPVPGFEGRYSVSDLGRVRSEPRVVIRRDGRSFRISGGFMTAKFKHGYLMVKLHRPGLKPEWRHRVHLLVLGAFVGPRPPGLEGCHRDNDKNNNRLTNLRYDTRAGNHADNGIRKCSRRQHWLKPGSDVCSVCV